MDDLKRQALVLAMSGVHLEEIGSRLGVSIEQVRRWTEEPLPQSQDALDRLRAALDQDGSAVEAAQWLGEDNPVDVNWPVDPEVDPNLLEVTFPDVVAHLLKRMVRASVDAIQSFPGVIDAWQEDTELILVKQRGVDPRELQSHLRNWFAEKLREEIDAESLGGQPTV